MSESAYARASLEIVRGGVPLSGLAEVTDLPLLLRALSAPALVPAAASTSSAADVTRRVSFQDHAALERDSPITLFGHGSLGRAPHRQAGGRTATTHADAAGRWSATLPALPVSGPRTCDAAGPDATRSIADVFLCFGRSNTELSGEGRVVGRLPSARTSH